MTGPRVYRFVPLALFVACSAPEPIAPTGPDGATPDGAAPDATADGPIAVADAPPSAPVRFVMMADTGTGGSKQYAVAAAIRAVCAAEGCDFVVLAGDNLYPDGADSVDDPIWQEKFELPYAGIDVPFHAVLGNHDFGITGNDWTRDAAQLAYGAVSPRWNMPATHYTMRHGPVGFVMLDTNRLLWSRTDAGDQRAWWAGARAEVASAPWIVAVGHHPIRSNGTHGNAGSYGTEDQNHDFFVPPHENPGVDIKQFFDDHVCGQVDVYVSGHDHSREWLNAPEACGGTELIVVGAGGTVAPFERDDTPVWWQDDRTAGFLYVVADAHRWRGRFFDMDGSVAFERTLVKN